MDKNIIKNYLKAFVSEAVSPTPASTPALKLAKKIGKEEGKQNKQGVEAIAKDMTSYEKALTKDDPNQKSMAPNKYNYEGDNEVNYHDQMEIMNGQEMIQYDREPNSRFKERAMLAIEGDPSMGNSSKYANVVQKGWGGDPEFGKNLVKQIKASEKKRTEQTPTSKMFGDDWEVVKDKGHKAYAFESVEDKTKCPVCNKDKSECKCTDKEKGEHAMKGLDADYEKDDRKQQYKYNENNKKQIKETMKRLKFNKEFNGFGNALKLIPESYKVDKKVFEMTDGNEHYRIRWEGSINEGSAVILMASDKSLVNEDMDRMKRLMGYKSQDTLGTVKGQERITENAKFNDIWNKTKKLMNEIEDNDGGAEEDEWDDAITSQAPEAKKNIQGSASTDKGTQGTAKTGHWEAAAKSQAPEAKKHVQGSVSSSKATQATAKTGNLEDAIKSQAPEAKKNMQNSLKKKLSEAFDDADELSDRLDSMKNGEDDDAPIVKRKDAYDASLDVPDLDDMEKSITTTDIEKSAPETIINKDMTGDDEDDVRVPELKDSPYKLMKNSKGEYGIILSMGGKKELVAMVPDEYIEIALKDPSAALDAIKSSKEMSDDDIMETLNEILSEINKK
jgi:hypothetical protein